MLRRGTAGSGLGRNDTKKRFSCEVRFLGLSWRCVPRLWSGRRRRRWCVGVRALCFSCKTGSPASRGIGSSSNGQRQQQRQGDQTRIHSRYTHTWSTTRTFHEEEAHHHLDELLYLLCLELVRLFQVFFLERSAFTSHENKHTQKRGYVG